MCLTIIIAALMQFVENKLQERVYYEWVYFMIVTISLVGFGDVFPQTDSGPVSYTHLTLPTILLV